MKMAFDAAQLRFGGGLDCVRNMRMKVSVATYAYHGLLADGVMDVFGCLETVRFRHGLRAVDIWNDFTPDELAFNPDFQTKVRRGLIERELVHANYCVDGCHVWWPAAEERAAARDVAMKQLQAGVAMGAETIRIDAGGVGTEWTDEQFDTIAATMREFAQFAHDNGIKAGPESHWGPELVPDNMERLAKAVDHPGFGILIHLGHWEGVSSDEGDRLLAPWCMHTHVDARTTETRLADAIAILQKAGYTGYLGVEHHTGRNEYAEVAYQVAAVQRTLADIASDEPLREPKLREPGGMPDHI